MIQEGMSQGVQGETDYVGHADRYQSNCLIVKSMLAISRTESFFS
jgi:hypothetical protein